jgi:hypothetical protein
MKDRGGPADARRVSRSAATSLATPLAAWLGLGLSAGFLLWVVGSGEHGLAAPAAALGAYAWWVLVGLAVAAVLVAVGAAAQQRAWLARASYASCLFYLGFLVVLDWRPLPWVLLAGACLLLVPLRRSDLTNASGPLVLLHAMGSLGALYMSFQLRTFLAAWPAFRDVLAALWLALTPIAH